MSERPCFEIGLVLAGAVSAGAYTAGVMDFLMEALEDYYAERDKPDWDGPTHDVRISVMAGASAGGMTAAISALHVFRDEFDHFWPDNTGREPAQSRNRLYSSWVQDIDILPLLATTDLDGEKAKYGVKSALCSDVIDGIVNNAFEIEGKKRAPEWVGRDSDRSLRVFMTLTNLRGVPYSFPLYGTDDPRKYGMLNHSDYREFKVGISPTPENGVLPLDICDTSTPDWDSYRTAAKATGAFPIGLAPRLIARPPIDYYYSRRVGRDSQTGFATWAPDDSVKPCDPYVFLSVDGGATDNEPLELARRYLASGTGRAHNERSGDKADRAIILIAPFPNFQQTPTEDKRDGITDVIPRLFLSALIQQARFKPDELALAANENVYSRYIISPAREGSANPDAIKYPIACGVLGAFGGFLHKSFRCHDYLLGRRNAQAFLRWNFALPEINDLFFGYTTGHERWYVRDINGKPKEYETAQGKKCGLLPIIPLTPSVRREIMIGSQYLPDPDYFSQDSVWNDLVSRIQRRANTVISTLVDVDLKDLTTGWLGWAKRMGAIYYGTEITTTKAKTAIKCAIEEVRNAFFK